MVLATGAAGLGHWQLPGEVRTVPLPQMWHRGSWMEKPAWIWQSFPWHSGESQPEDVAECPNRRRNFFKQVSFYGWISQSHLQCFCAVQSCCFGRETPMTWSEHVAGQLGVVPSECRTPRPGTLPLTSRRPLVFMVYVPFQFMVMHVIADQTATAIASMEK